MRQSIQARLQPLAVRQVALPGRVVVRVSQSGRKRLSVDTAVQLIENPPIRFAQFDNAMAQISDRLAELRLAASQGAGQRAVAGRQGKAGRRNVQRHHVRQKTIAPGSRPARRLFRPSLIGPPGAAAPRPIAVRTTTRAGQASNNATSAALTAGILVEALAPSSDLNSSVTPRFKSAGSDTGRASADRCIFEISPAEGARSSRTWSWQTSVRRKVRLSRKSRYCSSAIRSVDNCCKVSQTSGASLAGFVWNQASPRYCNCLAASRSANS